MKVGGVSKSRKRVWTLWLYLLGFPIVAGFGGQVGSRWPWDVILGGIFFVSYALLAWLFLRLIVRPRVEWNIDATNSQNIHLKVVYSTVPSRLIVLVNGRAVSEGRSWRLALAVPERVEFPLGSQPDHDAVLTLRPSLWSTLRLSLAVDGQHMADA